MKAIVIGPGKIGCGYLCPLFLDAGWETVLAARTQETAERIRSAAGFAVRITGMDVVSEIRDVRAVVTGTPEFDAAVASADLVITAVGVRSVAELGVPLARALGGRRSGPAQIWVVENQDCAPVLESSVREAAADLGVSLPPMGFAGGVAEVAVAHGHWLDPGRPVFVGDRVRRLRIDEEGLVTALPRLPAVERTRCYRARLQEKLFVFNAGHALCAYLGALRGYPTIDRAVRDSSLRALVAGCMLEARRALASAYPGLGGDVLDHVAKMIRRYEDSELADPVSRVGRDPLRKLAPGDRLLGAAELIRKTHGRVPAHLVLGIAGALLYRDDADDQARRLAELLRRNGLAAVLQTVCGLAPEDELAQAISRCYRGFILTASGALFPPVYEPAVREPDLQVA